VKVKYLAHEGFYALLLAMEEKWQILINMRLLAFHQKTMRKIA
jgi:hypothetical protein